MENGISTIMMKWIMGDDERAILDVDGAYMCSRVFFNDNHMAFHPYGYTPFLVDLTPKMRKNRPNKIEITTRNLPRCVFVDRRQGACRTVGCFCKNRFRR